MKYTYFKVYRLTVPMFKSTFKSKPNAHYEAFSRATVATF